MHLLPVACSPAAHFVLASDPSCGTCSPFGLGRHAADDVAPILGLNLPTAALIMCQREYSEAWLKIDEQCVVRWHVLVSPDCEGSNTVQCTHGRRQQCCYCFPPRNNVRWSTLQCNPDSSSLELLQTCLQNTALAKEHPSNRMNRSGMFCILQPK